jgi:hypothetical protein
MSVFLSGTNYFGPAENNSLDAILPGELKRMERKNRFFESDS